MFDHLPLAAQRAFLAAYVLVPRIGRSATAAGIARETHYAWLNRYSAYVEAFAVAETMAGDLAEDEAKRRAIQGVTEPFVYRGQVVMHIDKDGLNVPLMRRRYSDSLLALILQGSKPEKYSTQRHANADGKALPPLAITVTLV